MFFSFDYVIKEMVNFAAVQRWSYGCTLEVCYPTSTSWDDYKRQRNNVTSLKRNALKRFCCDASLSARHPGEFWRKMKPVVNANAETSRFLSFRVYSKYEKFTAKGTLEI